MMSRVHFLILGSAAAITTSCNEKATSIEVTGSSGLRVIEKRKSGAGPAPDSVKAFLVDAPTGGLGDLIFEGQDVGRACYKINNGLLTFNISGGYLDVIRSQATTSGGVVKIKRDNSLPCKWSSRKLP